MYSTTRVHADNSTTASTSTQSGWITSDGHQQWIDENGKLTIGWKLINGSWYYFNEIGNMHTGWLTINQYHYYLNSSGVMLTGWQYIEGHWYYLTEGGASVSRWQFIDNYWYYFEPSNRGTMAKGWLNLNGNEYYLRTTSTIAPAGSMISNGYLTENGYIFHFSESGLKGSYKSINEIINLARTFVGKVPYEWGGKTPSGFDCSGLVAYCYD
mgnify:CR=1 FL=1